MGCRCDDTHGKSDEGQAQPSDIEIAVEPFGPDPAAFETASRALLTHPTVAGCLAGAEHRLLSLRLADEEHASKHQTPCPPDSLTATVYDYANRRVLEATGRLAEIEIGAASTLSIRERGHEPLPSRDEFADAVDIVCRDREIRALIAN